MTDNSSKRPLVFASVGVVNTLIDFIVYTILTQTVLKDHVAIAGAAAGTVALFFAFVAHSLITWRGRHIGRQTLLRFIGFTSFGSWVIRPLCLMLFIRLTGFYDFAEKVLVDLGVNLSHSFIANTGAYGLMTVVLLIYNYLVYDRYVFKKQRGL